MSFSLPIRFFWSTGHAFGGGRRSEGQRDGAHRRSWLSDEKRWWIEPTFFPPTLGKSHEKYSSSWWNLVKPNDFFQPVWPSSLFVGPWDFLLLLGIHARLGNDIGKEKWSVSEIESTKKGNMGYSSIMIGVPDCSQHIWILYYINIIDNMYRWCHIISIIYIIWIWIDMNMHI